MKLKLSLFLAATAALSVVVAAPAKPPARDPNACRPTVSFVLKGTFDAAAATGFTMDVKSANHHGRQYAGQAGVQVTVDQSTKFRRNGRAQLSDLVAGDRLLVQVRACKNQAAQQPSTDPNAPPAAPPVLLAKRVVAHPAATSSDGSDDSGSSPQPTTP